MSHRHSQPFLIYQIFPNIILQKKLKKKNKVK